MLNNKSHHDSRQNFACQNDSSGQLNNERTESINEKDSQSLECLMQEYDCDTTVQTTVNEVVEVSAKKQVTALSPVEEIEPYSYAVPQATPLVGPHSTPLQLVYLQPTQYGVNIIPFQAAGQPTFTPHCPTGFPAHPQHPVVVQPGLSFPVPQPTYSSPSVPDATFTQPVQSTQPTHGPPYPLPYPVYNQPYFQTYSPNHQPFFPNSPTSWPAPGQMMLPPYPGPHHAPTIPSPYTSYGPVSPTPYPVFGPTSPPTYAMYGSANQPPFPMCVQTPNNQAHYTENVLGTTLLPHSSDDKQSHSLVPSDSIGQTVKEQRFFRPWEVGGEEFGRSPKTSEEDRAQPFAEEDFPALNKEFNKLKIKK